MARTRQEVRNFLSSLAGQMVNEKCGVYNGQCVSLVKALLEFLGAPNPYAARGNAITVGDTLIRQGIAANRGGWLNVCVNRDMGRIFENGVWNNYGHIWIDLSGEMNVEQNGARALRTTINTRPISQAQQIVNLDQYIREENMPTLIDEEGVRILAVGVLNRPEPLTTTPDLRGHIGGDALAKLKEFWYSPEGRAANRWQQAAPALIATQAQAIDALNQKIAELSDRPTKEALVAVQKAADEATAARDAIDKAYSALKVQAEEDEKVGNAFTRWIGAQLNKLIGKE